MNALLQKKYNDLNNAEKYECWYLVKQPTDFSQLCYLVSALEAYQKSQKEVTLEEFIVDFNTQLNNGVELSGNYRALRVAAFFGLIRLNGNKYENASLTPTFKEIKQRTNGEYQNIHLYIDIVERQIEKIFLSSDIDEKKDDIRSKFRLYPVMLLYKLLVELGKATGKYEIDIDEYRYLVATTETYDNFLDTLIYIKLFREYPEDSCKFDRFREKFDNRFIQALSQLPTLNVDSRNKISVEPSCLLEITKKVYSFENYFDDSREYNYLDFLGSTKSLLDRCNVHREFEPLEIQYHSEKSRQQIFFGAPGTGKSFSLNREATDLVDNHKERIERVTFHPDYAYANFVGTYKPIMKSKGSEEKITYEYVPGPFMRTLVNALRNPSVPYVLIVEEINRANVAAVFGDVFQLLDRDDCGNSQYNIAASEDIRNYLNKELGQEYNEIGIPSNMFIWATMNSADQGVYPMDTAFKRRWDFTYFGINDGEEDLSENAVDKKFTLGSNRYACTVSWNDLRKAINNELLGTQYNINEDKLMGPFFMSNSALVTEDKFKDVFKNKVLMYLFEDVVKQKRRVFFEKCSSDGKGISYSDICHEFNQKGIEIFPDSIVEKLKSVSTDSSNNMGTEE